MGTISTRDCSDEVSELGFNDYCCNLGNDDDSDGDVYRKYLVAQAKYESARAELNDLKLRNDKDNEMMNLLKEREEKLAKLKQQLDEQLELTEKALEKQEEHKLEILAKESTSKILDGQKEETSKIVENQEEAKEEILNKLEKASTDLCVEFDLLELLLLIITHSSTSFARTN